MKSKLQNTIDAVGLKLVESPTFIYIAEVANVKKTKDNTELAIEIGVNVSLDHSHLIGIIDDFNNTNNDLFNLIPRDDTFSINDDNNIEYYFENVYNTNSKKLYYRQIQKPKKGFTKILGGDCIFTSKTSMCGGTLGAIVSVNEKKYGITAKHNLGDTHSAVYCNLFGGKRHLIGHVSNKYILKDIDISFIKIHEYYKDYATKGVRKIGSINNIRKTPSLEDKVYKYGSATKLTQGKIKSIYAKRKVKNSLTNKFFMVKCDSNCRIFGDNGDSGSLVLSKDNNEPMGISTEKNDDKIFVVPIDLIDKEINGIKFN